MRANLPYHKVALPLGMVTKVARHTVAGQALLSCQNMDGYGTFRGLGKIPGSTKITSSAMPAQVDSLHQFEFTDLALVRRRHQLALADGKLYRIESDGSTTQLTSGLENEALREARMLDRLHLTSPEQRGLATGGITYDGTRVQNWGVKGPGTTETALLALDSHSGWIVSSPDVTAGTDSANSKDGGGSLQVNKVGTAGTVASVEQGGLGLDFSVAGDETVFVWLFLPLGSLQKLASATALQISYGSAALVDANHHDFDVGALLPGWNLLSFVTSSPSSQSGGGATLASVDTLRFKLNFAASANTLSGVLFDHLHHTDEPAPTVSSPSDTGTLHDFSGSTNYSTSADGALFDHMVATGDLAVRVDKTGTSQAFVDVERDSLSLDMTPTDAKDTTRSFRVYIPAAAIAKLASVGLWITVGDSGLSNANTYTFGTASLTSGWQTLTFDTASVGNTVGDGASLDSIDTIRVRFRFTAASSTQTGFRMHWLRYESYEAGNVAGTVSYRITFVSDKGVESNAGLPSDAITIPSSGGKVDLASIPTSADSQVIARRIYRDLDSDNLFRLVAQIDDNSTTTYQDNISTAGLSLTSPPIAGDDQKDNSPPGRFQDVAVHGNRLIAIDADDRFTLHVSPPNQPEVFPILDQLQMEDELIGFRDHALGTMLRSSDKDFLIQGDGVTSPIVVTEVNPQMGANGFRSTMRIKGTNLVVREDDVFLVADPQDPWHLNGPILDQFEALPVADYGSLHCQHDRSRYRGVFFAKNGSSWTVFVYQYGTLAFQQITGDGTGTDPQDVRTGTWTKMALPSSVKPICSAMVERTDDLPELWIGADDGHVYWLQDPSATDWATAGGTEAISAEFETHAIPIGSDEGGRGEPRFLRLDADADAASTWEATVTLLTDADGDTVATSTFDVEVPAGKSSPVVPIPGLGARGEWVRVKLANAVSGESATFSQLFVYYIPRVGFRGARAA